MPVGKAAAPAATAKPAKKKVDVDEELYEMKRLLGLPVTADILLGRRGAEEAGGEEKAGTDELASVREVVAAVSETIFPQLPELKERWLQAARRG